MASRSLSARRPVESGTGEAGAKAREIGGRVGRNDFWRKVVHGQDVPLSQKNHPLDDIAQFADVAWPRIGHQRVEHFGRRVSGRRSIISGDLFDEMADKERNIFLVIGQRRQTEHVTANR